MKSRLTCVAVTVGIAMTALFLAGCTTPSPCTARIEEGLRAKRDSVTIESQLVYDALLSLTNREENWLNLMAFLQEGPEDEPSYFLSPTPTVTLLATNVTVRSALHETLRQAGLTYTISHEALVIGTDRSLAYLKSLPPFPSRTSRHMARCLDVRWEGEWPPCLGNVNDVVSILSELAGIPIDLGHTRDWPLLFVRPGVRDMTVRNLLWWTAAYGGKEIVIRGEGVSFRERDGRKTKSGLNSAETTIPRNSDPPLVGDDRVNPPTQR